MRRDEHGACFLRAAVLRLFCSFAACVPIAKFASARGMPSSEFLDQHTSDVRHLSLILVSLILGYPVGRWLH
jgi:hypothetical protein